MVDPHPTGTDPVSHRGTWLSVALTVALVAATAVVVATDRDAPREQVDVVLDESAVVPTDPLSVTVTGPIGGGSDQGQRTELSATVLAREPLKSIELWDGETLVESRDVEGTTRDLVTAWTWTPNTSGSRPVVVRAVDDAGAVGQSAPLWVEVAPAPAAGGRGSYRAPSSGRRSASTDGPPPVELDATRCTAIVRSASPEGVVHLARPGAAAFTAVPSSRATRGVSLTAGTHLVHTVSRDGDVGPFTEVTAPEHCSERLWTGDVRITDGRLVTAHPADRAYVYLAVDGGPWRRVPSGDGTFAVRDDEGAFDLRKLLPPLAGSTLDVHAWGRDGGRLVNLGRGRLSLAGVTPDRGGSDMGMMAAATGAPASDLDWIVQRAGKTTPEIPGPPADILAREGTLSFQKGTLMTTAMFAGAGRRKLEFRWSSASGAATHAVWQVSSLPPPASPQLAFPGLLAYQVVGAPGGEFTIDVDDVVKGVGPKQSIPVESVSFGDVVPPEVVEVPQAVPSAAPTSAPHKKLPPKSKQPLHLLPVLNKKASPSALYVRVVPMAGSQPIPTVTNLVVFGIGDAPPPMLLPTQPGGTEAPKIASTSVTFIPPHQPNGSFHRCVRVVENPHAPTNTVTVAGVKITGKPAPVGGTLCADYVEPEKEWWDYVVDAVEFVADTWTEIATFVNQLKADVISFMADLGCSQALDATGAVDDPKSACSKMITSAVDTYLAANGIPPTLPTTEDVTVALKGDLAAFAAGQAGEYCPDLVKSECTAEAEKIAAEILDRVEREVSDATKERATSGNWQLLVADDIRVVPEPAGQFGPAVFQVTVNLASPPATDTYCTVHPQVVGTHPSWTYVTTSQKAVTKPIQGDVFLPQAGTIRIPAGAATAAGTVALVHLNTAFAPAGASIYNTTAYKKTAPYLAWFDPASTLTMRLTGCSLDSSNAATSVIAGGLPYPKSPAEVQLP